LTIVHPLQAFSPEYFRDSSPHSRLYTFGREWALAATAPTEMVETETRLPAIVREEPLSIQELKAFAEHPVREFFRQRLQVNVEEGEVVADEETFVADGLDTWALHDALIQAARKPLEAGADPAAACENELERLLRRGDLAFGGAGRLQVDRAREQILPMLADYRQCLQEWPVPVTQPHELRHLCDGTPGLVGWLGELRRNASGDLIRVEMQATRLVNSSNQWREEKL